MASNATGAHVRQRIGARDRCNTIRRKCLGRLPGQYSLGKRNVVALRSASVIIQSFTPVRGSLYAERIRNPSITDRSFSRRSSSQRSPQSPETWRLRNSRPLLPSSLRASSAPGVLTVWPRGNSGLPGWFGALVMVASFVLSDPHGGGEKRHVRSEEHTSEL